MNNQYPSDPGEQAARKCKVYGVISLFFFPIVFCVLSLRNYRKYRETGTGEFESHVKAGKICSVVSIAMQSMAVMTAVFLILLGITVETSTVTVKFPEDTAPSAVTDVYENTEGEWGHLSGQTFDL